MAVVTPEERRAKARLFIAQLRTSLVRMGHEESAIAGMTVVEMMELHERSAAYLMQLRPGDDIPA